MRNRFRHATHIVCVAVVFLVGIVCFLIARWVLVPPDFGTLGFYRAGALDDVRARPIAYGGGASCVGCHVGKYESEDIEAAEKLAGASLAVLTKDNRHSVLRCETCHGPLAFHVVEKKKKEADEKAGKEADDKAPADKPVPLVAGDKLCLGCHAQITGRPGHQPQVLVGDHGANDKCDSCHRPHRPRTDEGEE